LLALDAEDLSLGGEQSGHVIFRHRATTGDGLLSGIFLADLILRRGQSLVDLAAGVLTLFPQRLVAVEVDDLAGYGSSEVIADSVAAAEAQLGADGRILVRVSGTEPVVRVMVEAADEAVAEQVSGDLVEVILAELGGSVR
jgi:phosphoglucosamine mutase